MPAQVITVAQQKGGAGKTTMAAHLGVAWAQEGRRVALLDADPQGSLAVWHSVRGEGATPRLPLRRISGWRLATEVSNLRRDSDLVLVDSPPHAETDARVAIRAANLVLIPLQPSPMDFWAMRATLDVAAAERVPVLLVLNRVPARGRLPGTVLEALAADGVPVAQGSLGSRQAFASSLLVGQGVTEAEPRGSAAREVRALCAEILARLNGAGGR